MRPATGCRRVSTSDALLNPSQSGAVATVDLLHPGRPLPLRPISRHLTCVASLASLPSPPPRPPPLDASSPAPPQHKVPRAQDQGSAHAHQGGRHQRRHDPQGASPCLGVSCRVACCTRGRAEQGPVPCPVLRPWLPGPSAQVAPTLFTAPPGTAARDACCARAGRVLHPVPGAGRGGGAHHRRQGQALHPHGAADQRGRGDHAGGVATRAAGWPPSRTRLGGAPGGRLGGTPYPPFSPLFRGGDTPITVT